MKWVDIDDKKLGFGKYKKKTPNELMYHDPCYIKWMYENVRGEKCTGFVYSLCCEIIEAAPQYKVPRPSPRNAPKGSVAENAKRYYYRNRYKINGNRR